MARIWVVCFLAQVVFGNMSGTLFPGTLKETYTRMEMLSKTVKDLYYLAQMNRKLFFWNLTPNF